MGTDKHLDIPGIPKVPKNIIEREIDDCGAKPA